MSGEKKQIREAFTKQADSYANSAVIAAEEARMGFMQFVGPLSTDRVLDVATGPGFLALIFAEKTAEVVGIDLTPAMLERAEVNRIQKKIINIRFQEGDAESLPFPDDSFDIVTCGSAFHHFSDTLHVLNEMKRVAKEKGKIAILDIVTSETPEKAILHNQLERWRDPSHTRNLSLSEFNRLFKRAGLQNIRTATYGTPRELNEWFEISKSPPNVREMVRKAFIASVPGDRTGLNVHLEGEHVFFMHTFVWIVGSKS